VVAREVHETRCCDHFHVQGIFCVPQISVPDQATMPDSACLWLAQLHEIATAPVSRSGSPATRCRDRSRRFFVIRLLARGSAGVTRARKALRGLRSVPGLNKSPRSGRTEHGRPPARASRSAAQVSGWSCSAKPSSKTCRKTKVTSFGLGSAEITRAGDWSTCHPTTSMRVRYRHESRAASAVRD